MPSAEELLTRKLDAIGFRTSLVRDLSGRGPVERKLIDREELYDLLFDELTGNPEELLVTQKLYETLGIISAGTDLPEILVGVFTDVVGRFYSTDFGKPYVVANREDFQPHDEIAVVHEFAHELQQLEFDISAIRESISGNADQSRAFTALVEGDAVLTHLLYMGEHLEIEEQEDAQITSDNSDISRFFAAPTTIQQLTLFPYLDGRSFAVDLFLRTQDFEAIDEVYAYVPRSTEQIIHMEKYDAREEPDQVSLPDMATALGEGWTELDRDTLGELFIGAYLLSGVEPDDSSLAATGWGGDQYVLLENEAGQGLFVSMIVWDSVEDAVEFDRTYQEMVEFIFGGTWEENPDVDSLLTMSTPTQHALIDLDGLITVIALSPDLESGLVAMGSATSSSVANVPWNVAGPGRGSALTVASFGAGVQQVYLDIQPGTYRNSDSSDGCYWARLASFSGEVDDIIADGTSLEPVIVTISDTDVGFESVGCGSWTKVDS